jgi:MFS family permease
MNQIKVAILSASSIMMITMVTSPILAEMARAFPDATDASVQMIVVLPGLVAVPVSLFSGRLATLFPKKSVVLFAMAVMMAGGLLPFLFHQSITAFQAASFVVGIGLGFMIPFTTTLISDYFEGLQRGAVLGQQSAIINMGAMVTVILAGLLARISWLYAYGVFLLILPAMICFAVLLPKEAVDKPVAGDRFRLGPALIYICLVGFVFAMLNTTYSTNVAMYLDAAALGDATSAGIATALLTGAGVVAGVLFGRLLKAFKGFTLPLAISLGMAGLFLTFMGGSLAVVLVAGFLCGSGFAMIMPLGIFQATRSVSLAASTLAIAVYTSSVSIGSFVSPLMVNSLAGLSGDDSVKARFLVAGLGMLALFTVTLARELLDRRETLSKETLEVS